MTNLLTQSFTLASGLVIKNRLVKSAMTEGLAETDQLPNELHFNLYKKWVDGQTGLLITGNVMIDPEQLERPGNIAYSPQHHQKFVQAWQPILAYCKQAQTPILMQLSHPGRQCPAYVHSKPWAPSPVKLDFLGNYGLPHAMSAEEIQLTLERFVAAALAAQEAGFDGVQIHAAHGYLISSFLSPLTNQRQDQWGQDLAGRMKFLCDLIKDLRGKVKPSFTIAVKLNLRDFKKGGFSLDDCSQVILQLNQLGVDLLEVSGGSYEQPVILGRPYSELDTTHDLQKSAYFSTEAQFVRKIAQMPLILTGGIRRRVDANELLANQVCDFIGLARPLCIDPQIGTKLLNSSIEVLPEESSLLFPQPRRAREGEKISTSAILNVLSSLAWYFAQIEGLAKNKNHSAYGPKRALLNYFWGEYSKIIKLKLSKRFSHRSTQ